MFSQFSRMFDAVKSAAGDISEALTADRVPVEEFKNCWQTITDVVLSEDQTGAGTLVSDTVVPRMFDRMLELLMEETTDSQDATETGPCLEYMLSVGTKGKANNGLLFIAVNLGQGNYPVGMLKEVLSFHKGLLKMLKAQIIPHVGVYQPIKLLIDLCTRRHANGKMSAQEQLAFVDFLRRLCLCLTEEPQYTNFFIEVAEDASARFGMLEATAPLLQVAQGKTAKLARETFLTCVELSAGAPEGVAAGGGVCETLVDGFVPLWAALALEPDEVDADTASALREWAVGGDARIVDWRWLNEAFKPKSSRHSFKPKSNHYNADNKALLAAGRFVSWLLFVDEAVLRGDATFGAALRKVLLERFLQLAVSPRLLQPGEEVATLATEYVTVFLAQVSSPDLVDALVTMITGNATDHGSGGGVAPHLDVLVARCDDMSDDLSLATLALFHHLLASHSPRALDALVLTHIEKVMDGEESRAAAARDTGKSGKSHRSKFRSLADKLLTLLPDDLKTGSTSQEACAPLFIDAHELISYTLGAVASWDADTLGALTPPSAAATAADAAAEAGSASSTKTTAGSGNLPVAEMPAVGTTYTCSRGLVPVLCRRLRRLLDLPYAINLRVTGLLVLLLRFPHTPIHGVLLGDAPGSSVISMLAQVRTDLTTRAEKTPALTGALHALRGAMSSGESDLIDGGSPIATLASATLVLEEFCKEVAAMLLVKSEPLLAFEL